MDESVEAGPSVHDNPLDIEQIRLEAQNRWLSHPQICQILQNYVNFGITSELPNKPRSGSLFLVDKKGQRYFTKDGYNWTKESHREFKVESFGDLKCYYTHVKENGNFKRRRYWMPKMDFSDIVLVHYLEETGEGEDFSCVKEVQVTGPYSQGQESVEIMPNSNIDSSMCPGSHPNNCRVLSVSECTDTVSLPNVSECTDTASLPNGAQALELENAQSEYNHKASSGFHFGLELQQPAAEQIDAGGSDPKVPVPLFNPNSFPESLSTINGIESDPTQLDMGNSDADAELAKLMHDLSPIADLTISEDDGGSFTPSGESIEHGSLDSSSLSMWPMDQKLSSESACDATSKFYEQEVNHLELMNSVDPQQIHPDLRNNNSKENFVQRLLSNEKHSYVLQPDSDGDSKFEGKSIYPSSIGQHLLDELLTEQGSKKRSSSGANGETGENENENDVSSVPSEGKLDIQDINTAENYSDSAKANLLLRFVNILCSGSSATNSITSSLEDASQLSSKISSLLKGGNKEFDQTLMPSSGKELSSEDFKEQLLLKLLKEQLRVWLLQKVAEGGKGPSVLDEGGQGVLHLAAALGYDWALEPTIVAGVNVDFRDVNGWTALHWAASYGRKRAVLSLILLRAAPGALTDRSLKYPSVRTPADLASVNGHKGIARYLAYRSLDVYIPSTNLDHEDDSAGPKAVQKISEITAAPLSLGNASGVQSRKDFYVELTVLRAKEIQEGNARFLEFFRKVKEYANKARAELLKKEDDEGPDDEGPDNEGPDDEGPDDEGADNEGADNEGPLNKKEEGKKRAPDPALESEKASKILKAYLASMALLTAYCNVQSMKTIQILVLVSVEASKKPGQRRLSYIDNGFELSAIRV